MLILCAIGGMVCPAIIYSLFNRSLDSQIGWGIPMATDTAFALGVLTLVRKHIPRSPIAFPCWPCYRRRYRCNTGHCNILYSGYFYNSFVKLIYTYHIFGIKQLRRYTSALFLYNYWNSSLVALSITSDIEVLTIKGIW
ncbi:MAG: hypothetical protein ACI8P3_001462 [Saprospiraceae bacterium]|jgi:hypothetical protein